MNLNMDMEIQIKTDLTQINQPGYHVAVTIERFKVNIMEEQIYLLIMMM